MELLGDFLGASTLCVIAANGSNTTRSASPVETTREVGDPTLAERLSKLEDMFTTFMAAATQRGMDGTSPTGTDDTSLAALRVTVQEQTRLLNEQSEQLATMKSQYEKFQVTAKVGFQENEKIKGENTRLVDENRELMLEMQFFRL